MSPIGGGGGEGFRGVSRAHLVQINFGDLPLYLTFETLDKLLLFVHDRLIVLENETYTKTTCPALLFHTLWSHLPPSVTHPTPKLSYCTPESIELFIEDQAFLRSYNSAPRPPPTPPPSGSCLYFSVFCVSPVEHD
jgi:hypothetical protein